MHLLPVLIKLSVCVAGGGGGGSGVKTIQDKMFFRSLLTCFHTMARILKIFKLLKINGAKYTDTCKS